MHFLGNYGSFSGIFKKVGLTLTKHRLRYKNEDFKWIWIIEGKFRDLRIRELVFLMGNMQK